MGLAPFALSVHHFISSVGADAGFASIIGLAVLVLLYFAQARETASLREQAELWAQRVDQLERRLTHAGAAQAAPAPTPAPPGIQPLPRGFPATGARPVPTPPPVLPSTPAAAPGPAPPAGVAAPPLSAATKLIPTPPPLGLATAGITGLAGRSPLGQPPPAGGHGPGVGAGQASSPAGGHAPVAATPAEAPPANPPASPLAPASPPGSASPMSQIVTPRPATAAGGAARSGPTASNGTGEAALFPPPPPPPPPRPPVQIRPGGSGGGHARMLAELDEGGRSSSDLTRVLMALAAVAVVAAIVIVLLSVTGGSTAHTTSNPSPPVSNAPAPAHHTRPARSTAVNDAAVTVGVLNGTAVYHLANSIATQLTADGFKQGTIANAATQTQPSTTVEYASGDQRDAAAVAKALKLSSSAVQPMTPDTQTLGCPQAGSCTVVVTVGADLASSGTQTQTTP